MPDTLAVPHDKRARLSQQTPEPSLTYQIESVFLLRLKQLTIFYSIVVRYPVTNRIKMAEYTTEDTLLTNEFLSWSGDFDVDFNEIKLIAETIDEFPQLTMVEQRRVVQEPVEQPVSHQLIQPIVSSQVFEQQVSSHHEEQPDSPQFIQQPVSPQFMELSPVSPQTIEQPVSPQFVQPVSSQLEEQLTSSQLMEEPVPLYLITVNTPMSVNDNVSNTVEVLAQANPQRRGRKPQNTTGRVRKPRRQPKTKVYEMGPFVEEEAERKRQNAVNAKLHRDMKKRKMAHLESQLAEVTKERDYFQQIVANMQQNEKILLQKLKHQ
ncbi:hypothetical protein Pcinc_028689 [Petrolisthes cinctipes]|uniref:BZIP domain-containing protein n=2 Tax=Petrolisthes cinctipes TaxID=88211 RepID=A0AAE1F1U2_PETCI|nr:hypothetical protein Pcinc_028689 [Petrolisthes cinctipes]